MGLHCITVIKTRIVYKNPSIIAAALAVVIAEMLYISINKMVKLLLLAVVVAEILNLCVNKVVKLFVVFTAVGIEKLIKIGSI